MATWLVQEILLVETPMLYDLPFDISFLVIWPFLPAFIAGGVHLHRRVI
jgi:hypothetical protein